MRSFWKPGTIRGALVGLVLTATLACAGNLPKTVVKESTKEFDIDAEVVAFYSDLVKYDEKVSEEQQRLIGRIEVDPGTTLRPSDILHAICWRTPEFYNEFRGAKRFREGEYIYLVQQPLTSHIVRGYQHPANLFAKIHAKWRADFFEDEKSGEDGFSLKSNRLVLKFEGFVDVKVEEVK